ncbi:MAG: hypothetical protein HY094_07235 [Candidatus Melainabacteria bacterium]|nr:hypothetical protein [Candidatus Melainabacteria bacterium]
MFASSTAEVLSFQKKKDPQDVFTKILYLHKKLKEAAQYESLSKTKYKLAKPVTEDLERIKQLELKLGYSLIAVESENEMEENKAMILNRIDSLLDEYMSMCKPGKSKLQNLPSQKIENDFNGFFE